MKTKVLEFLKMNTGMYVSGEALSEMLGVTRSAVWKYIREIKKDGYRIESSSKKGYMLEESGDILNETEIKCGLITRVLGQKTVFCQVIDSTNNHARRLALEGCPEGTVVVAEEQTSGKGRLGRQWNSMAGKGVWMSVVLRPPLEPEHTQLMTLAASLAVVHAVRDTAGICTGIKWPNDIILDGKKVCGILTEMNCEMERVNFVIIGIGVNVNQDEIDFPPEVRDKATSLKLSCAKKGSFPDGLVRSAIIQKILLELESRYNKILERDNESIINEWKKYSVTIGREIKYFSKGVWYTGIAEDITGDGKLVVKCPDGVTAELVSGEISVRGMLGYA